MAIFGSKKGKSQGKTKSGRKSSGRISDFGREQMVLLSPRVTEKAAIKSGDNVYSFNIDPRAGKKDVAEAIEVIYGVTPVKINTIKVPRKNVTRRGIKGKKSVGKKAMVFLKKGDSIEFI